MWTRLARRKPLDPIQSYYRGCEIDVAFHRSDASQCDMIRTSSHFDQFLHLFHALLQSNFKFDQKTLEMANITKNTVLVELSMSTANEVDSFLWKLSWSPVLGDFTNECAASWILFVPGLSTSTVSLADFATGGSEGSGATRWSEDRMWGSMIPHENGIVLGKLSYCTFTINIPKVIEAVERYNNSSLKSVYLQLNSIDSWDDPMDR